MQNIKEGSSLDLFNSHDIKFSGERLDKSWGITNKKIAILIDLNRTDVYKEGILREINVNDAVKLSNT